MTQHASDFYTNHVVYYEKDAFNARSSLTFEVLEFLKGKPWDDVALAFVHGFRPSGIRVTKGVCTCDSRAWRVTVFVDENNIIEKVEQECEVGLPEGVAHGSALREALKHGIDSAECQWHFDATEYLMNGISGVYYKRDAGGKFVSFPGSKVPEVDEDGNLKQRGIDE